MVTAGIKNNNIHGANVEKGKSANPEEAECYNLTLKTQ
jgi:hypothetical protein